MDDVQELFCAEDWDQRCHDMMRRMLDSLSRFSTPISISSNNDLIGKHIGTGSFLDLAGIKLLLSCEHVLGLRRNNRLAHRFLGLDRYVLLDGSGASAPEPIDAAVAAISPLAFREPWCRSQAIVLDRLALKHDPVRHELFFVHGFASENAQFVYDALRVDGTAYLCREVPLPENPRVDPQVHFALDYRRDVAIRSFGEHDLPDPHGMSGSLVWNTRYVQCAMEKNEWSPDHADITGLLWSWPREDKIVATRIEFVRGFLDCVRTSWSAAASQV